MYMFKPKAKVTVTHIGKPSGIAATARETPIYRGILVYINTNEMYVHMVSQQL
jgi:hypothetical protein